jgi:hypothetical protein
MKNQLLMATCIAACFAVSTVKAQKVNGVRLTDIKSKYIEISEVRSTFSRKIWIRLEYGQKIIDKNNDSYIKDDNGRELEFNSALDCVNKLQSYGYELFQAYTTKPDEDIKFYILKKN